MQFGTRTGQGRGQQRGQDRNRDADGAPTGKREGAAAAFGDEGDAFLARPVADKDIGQRWELDQFVQRQQRGRRRGRGPGRAHVLVCWVVAGVDPESERSWVCNRLDYPATCGPKGHGSSSAAAEATAVSFPTPARQSHKTTKHPVVIVGLPFLLRP